MVSHSPLLSTLRRRVRGIGLLLLAVMLGKLLVGGLCLADGATSVRAAGAQSVAAWAVAAAPELEAATPPADAAADCWHAGHGGCHCNCAHSAPVTTGVSMPHGRRAADTRFATPMLAQSSPPPANLLRPPIA